MTLPKRRLPKQRRARQTVEAVLDAVIRIVKREDISAVTTNRIAEVAGVSIGSVYQYFPDKQAIFIALHQRHIDQVDHIIQTKLVEHASASLDDLMEVMIDGMIEAHSCDPELYPLLATHVPHRAGGSSDFGVRLHGAFRLALTSRTHELKPGHDFDRLAFVVANLVDSLSHATLFQRPPRLSLAAAKAEVLKAVLAYLHS